MFLNLLLKSIIPKSTVIETVLSYGFYDSSNHFIVFD